MNLISKKDLLALTGISYGQLYRWKRERLIPEEWFIKQSSYTGQETFFPREPILSRIQSILDLKDQYSLEELARLLSPETSAPTLLLSNLREFNEIDPMLLDFVPKVYNSDQFDFFDVAFLVAITQALHTIGLTGEECEELLRLSVPVVKSQKNTNVTLTTFCIGKDYHIALSSNTAPIIFDAGVIVKYRINLNEISDQIKIKYKNQFIKGR